MIIVIIIKEYEFSSGRNKVYLHSSYEKKNRNRWRMKKKK